MAHAPQGAAPGQPHERSPRNEAERAATGGARGPRPGAHRGRGHERRRGGHARGRPGDARPSRGGPAAGWTRGHQVGEKRAQPAAMWSGRARPPAAAEITRRRSPFDTTIGTCRDATPRVLRCRLCPRRLRGCGRARKAPRPLQRHYVKSAGSKGQRASETTAAAPQMSAGTVR